MVFFRFFKTSGLFAFFALLAFVSCGTGKKEESGAVKKTEASEFIKHIESAEQLDTIMTKAGNNLIAFDLYADWCMPCRILSPTLEKIAKSNPSKVVFYKINIDKLPQVARDFGVSGIPLVVFMKNKTVVQEFVGVQPEEDYIAAITAGPDSSGK
jgi:thioredoxin 1